MNGFFLRGTEFELIHIIDGKLLPKMTFYKFSLNKQVSQTGLFIVELTALILFFVTISHLQSITLVLIFWVVAYGSLNCSIFRLYIRDRAEGGAGGALAPPLICKNKNKFDKK